MESKRLTVAELKDLGFQFESCLGLEDDDVLTLYADGQVDGPTGGTINEAGSNDPAVVDRIFKKSPDLPLKLQVYSEERGVVSLPVDRVGKTKKGVRVYNGPDSWIEHKDVYIFEGGKLGIFLDGRGSTNDGVKYLTPEEVDFD